MIRAPKRGFASERLRPLRKLGGLFLGLATSLGAASCLGVLDLDGYASVPESLCSLLDRCYGDAGFPKCRGHVSSQLTAADTDQKQSYLEQFSAAGCLDNCQSAWRCLDVAPVCRASRESCSTDEQCCGFSKGAAVCQRQACCGPSSAACKTDVDCCSDKCINGTCGGTGCKAAGEACSVGGECCTKQCLGSGTCSDVICKPDGFGCTLPEECCNGSCQNGMCQTASCSPDGASCLAKADCCSAAGCNATLGICGSASCLPESAPCTFNTNGCCSGMLCSPTYGVCVPETTCTANGQSCTSDDECCTLHCNGTCQCASDGGACGDGYECCSGTCINNTCGQCQQQGKGCTRGSDCCSDVCKDSACCAPAGCEHGVCSQGTPLGASACAGTSVAEAECIAKVCATDPVCCCDTWDQSCVDLVAPTCGLKCPGF